MIVKSQFLNYKLVLFVFIFCYNSLNAKPPVIYGEWSVLGVSVENLSIQEYLKKNIIISDYIKNNGYNNLRSFLFYKNFTFGEDGIDSQYFAKYSLNSENLLIYFNEKNIIYNFKIVLFSRKEIVMYDSISKLYFYLIKIKNTPPERTATPPTTH